MRLKFAFFPLVSALACSSLRGATTVDEIDSVKPAASAAPAPAAKPDSPVKPAMDAFQAGQHVKAVELATPLAAAGNADAAYLLGFAHETGQGAERSQTKAIEFYQKASGVGQRDAAYRLAFILLASKEEMDRDQARQSLEKLSKDDPAVSGRILGEAYLRGRFTKDPDPDKALEWWTTAGNAGDIPSLLLLARLQEGQFGFSQNRDLKKALATYRKAADLGDATAMAALGSRLLNGPEEIRDEKAGREWLQKAILAKDYSAYLALGDFEEKVKKDLKAALVAYERGKDAGQIDCTLRAADFYLEGKGVEKDVARGQALLQAAAKEGSPVAHMRLAVQELTADQPDILKGYGHLLSSAIGGLPEAQNELGLLYLSGKLATADPVAAVAWFARAAQSGYAQAQNNLATLYERGAGVPQSIENAAQLYLLAANQGNGPATLALARLQSNGTGASADLPKAWALATLAAERGEDGGTKLAEAIAEKFDAKQLEAAKAELAKIKKPAQAAAAAKSGAAKPEATPKKK
jgi:uncharacterized protein